MLKSYLKTALRSLYKNKLYSVINIFGLGVAMALCVVGYVNYEFSQSFNKFNENIDNIYLVASYKMENNQRQNWSYIPMAMGPAMREQVSGIEKLTRFSAGGSAVRYGDAAFNENLHFMDKDFFEIFTFPTELGNTEALSNPASLVITEKIALKYFGDQDPIGKTLTLSPDGDQTYKFTVGAVVSDPPRNSSIQFSIVLPFEAIKDFRGLDPEAWDNFSRGTFVQLSDRVTAASVGQQLQTYLELTNKANENWPLNGFYLTPLSSLAADADGLHGQYYYRMTPAQILAPSVTVILVLLLGCFNFINTAIAFAATRLKEIGIRKVIGGLRTQLVTQFIGENLVLCGAAVVLAAVLAEVFVPAYDSLWPEPTLTMDYSENLGLVGFLIGMLAFTGIAAGTYPAFYVSRFKPVQIFSGKLKLGGTNPLIRVLLSFQMALAMTSVIAAVILHQNGEFIQTLDLGYEQENVLVLPISGEEQYAVLRNAVNNYPDVISVGASRHLVGRSWTLDDVLINDSPARIGAFWVGEDYFETIGFELIKGRVFDATRAMEITNTCMVNEMLVKNYGWTEPIGQTITYKNDEGDEELQVVGVVRDFYPNSVNSRVRPTALRLGQPENYRYLSIKCQPEHRVRSEEFVRAAWQRLFPDRPYDGFWQVETIGDNLFLNESIRLFFLYIAVLVITISAMGLYALVSLNVTRRTRELGIRKVLGASSVSIGSLIAREFILLMVISSVLASVMGYFLVDLLLSNIWAYYCDFGVAPFVFSALGVMAVAAATVSFQVYSIATANPVEALRYE